MTNMNFFPPLFCTSLALVLAAATTAAEPVEPWASKVQLRSIEQAAYACSRDNSAKACARVRQLADPLMDHSSLPGLCKDVLWSLMDEAKVANSNDFAVRTPSPTPLGGSQGSAPSR